MPNSPAAKRWAPLKGSKSLVIMTESEQESNTAINGFDVMRAVSAAEYFIKAML